MFKHPYGLQLPSPLGTMHAYGSHHALHALTWAAPFQNTALPMPSWGDLLRHELNAYFSGTLQQFTTAVCLEGTVFQKRVWETLLDVSYGNTSYYGEIAQKIAQPKASQAVGQANAHNPVSILVPCHRIIGQKGSLVGYAGGIERKEWLLQHEQRFRSTEICLE
jgi:methylated-DNA-[protein]-cysteine S-methyltransferase